MLEVTLRYRVILEPKKEGGFNVVVPAFQSAHYCGSTRDEAVENACEVIKLMLDHLRAAERHLPPPI